jgi:hypothetical protein
MKPRFLDLRSRFEIEPKRVGVVLTCDICCHGRLEPGLAQLLKERCSE